MLVRFFVLHASSASAEFSRPKITRADLERLLFLIFASANDSAGETLSEN